jgi:hypothetical protein
MKLYPIIEPQYLNSMDKERIEQLDRRYPLYVEMSVSGGYDFMSYGAAPKVPPPRYVEFQMKFTVPESLDLVEGVALMYFQFDKFMKERYGAHVAEYMAHERGRRIDEPQTEPGTDTGKK